MNTKILRLAQKRFHSFQKFIAFKTSHLTMGGKIWLFWIVISFISLFFPWSESVTTIISSWNANIENLTAFSPLLWWIGYFLLIFLLVMTFFTFSIQKKEKIKYLSSYHITDFIALSVWATFIIILCIHTFILISGLKVFSWNIHHSHGIILCLCWSIISIFWSIVISWEYRKNIKWSYINNASKWQWEPFKVEEKDNMKLPF